MSVFKLFGEFAVRGLEEAEADIRSTTRVAEDSFEDMADAADRAADGLERGFKRSDVALGSFVGNLASNLISSGLDAISGAVSALIDTASESAEDFGKLEVAFDKAGYSAETASGVYRDFVGLLGETDQSVEAANHLAKLCKGEEELSQWTNIAAGVFAEFGDSLPLEGLTEAANETAKVGQVTGPLADALNWAGESEDAFNEKLAACADEQERAALITETLTGLYGESGEAYRETNADLIAYRESQAAANEAAAEAGGALLPLVATATDLGTAFIQKVTPALETFSGFVIDTALPAVRDFGGFVKDEALPTLEEWSPVIVGAATVIGGLAVAANAAAIATGVKTAAMTVSAVATEGLTIAQGALNAVMNANPLGIVITLLAGLAAALVTAYNTSDEFRAKVDAAWEGIKAAFSAGVEAVGGFLSDMWNNAQEIGQEFIDFFTSIPDRILGAFSGLGDKIKSAIGNIIPNISTQTVSAGNTSIEVPTISWFAKGGIVTEPTLGMLAEVGNDEAVLPLTPEGLKPVGKAVAAELGGGSDVPGAIYQAVKDAMAEAMADMPRGDTYHVGKVASLAEMYREAQLQKRHGLAGARS